MHNVIINGKKISAQDGCPLKEILEKNGFNFPCGGTGKCGRCRITSPDLAPTALDERFLSPRLLSEGVRLACDKVVTSSLTVTCELSAPAKPITPIKECSDTYRKRTFLYRRYRFSASFPLPQNR